MSEYGERTEAGSFDVAAAQSRLEPLRLAWRRKWILLPMMGIALGLGYLYALQVEPEYQSNAQVLLIRKEAKFPGDGPGGQEDPGGYGGYEDQLSTHILLIRSPLIVGKAVETHGLASLRSLKNTSDPVAQIIANLEATRARCERKAKPDPNVMDLQLRGPHAQDCKTILAAVVESYREFLAETYQDFSGETLKLISQAKDVLDEQLAKKETEYQAFRQSSPLLRQGDESANLHESRMAQIEEARSEVLVDITDTKARLETMENALSRGTNREALALLIGDTGESTPPAFRARSLMEDRLFTALLDEQEMLEDFGPDHPKVKAIRKKMNLMREYLGRMALPDDAEPMDFLEAYLESLRQELREKEERLAELDALFEQERASSKQLAQFQIREEAFRSDIDRTQRMFDAVVKRLEEINLVKDYGGITTQLLLEPSDGHLIWPNLLMILAPALTLGLVAGVGLMYLVELADKRFRNPEDVYQQLGLPLIGHIPVIDVRRVTRSRRSREAAEAPLDQILCTFHRPQSAQAEAYRAVRTSLYHSARGEGRQIIQITSPEVADGKTTLASNLAVSIAKSGKRVLLLDADFRRPRIHQYFDLDNTKGLSSLIADEAEVPEVLQATAVDNLWAITSGPRPRNPADLLTSPRFKELLDLLREQYVFVVVDTPPLLAVTDPAIVASRADGVLLVIRLTKHARDGAIRATKMLGALDAQMMGVVVNGVGKDSGYGRSYRYGAHRYDGYRYGYRSGYGYGYGDYKQNGDDGRGPDEKSGKGGGKAIMEVGE